MMSLRRCVTGSHVDLMTHESRCPQLSARLCWWPLKGILLSRRAVPRRQQSSFCASPCAQSLMALGCMEHRGGCSADNDSGDGAGLLTNVPWELFKRDLPDLKEAHTGCVRLAADAHLARALLPALFTSCQLRGLRGTSTVMCAQGARRVRTLLLQHSILQVSNAIMSWHSCCFTMLCYDSRCDNVCRLPSHPHKSMHVHAMASWWLNLLLTLCTGWACCSCRKTRRRQLRRPSPSRRWSPRRGAAASPAGGRSPPTTL